MATIVLDRDGVINHDSDDYIKSPDEWFPIDGSLDAIVRLKSAGYQVCVATNQSGIGRGFFCLDTLAAIHQKMITELNKAGGGIDLIAFCPHHPNEQCGCRKPKTGLLQAINQEFPLCPDKSWMVGDTLKDMVVAQRMGIRSALVQTGKGERELAKSAVSRETTPVFENLSSFVDWLLAD